MANFGLHGVDRAGGSGDWQTNANAGVYGESATNYGVAANSRTNNAVQAGSISGWGVVGTNQQKDGIFGKSQQERVSMDSVAKTQDWLAQVRLVVVPTHQV